MSGPGCGTQSHPIAPPAISILCLTACAPLKTTSPSFFPEPGRHQAAELAMRALAVASPVAASAQPRRRCLLAGPSCQMRSQLHTSFSGITVQCRPQKQLHSPRPRSSSVVAMTSRPSIQFIQGTDEQTTPDVRLTKSRDGTNGVAIFTFDQPSVFDSSAELGDITGFYMLDEEGTLSSVDVSAKFVNGKPAAVEAKYVMRTPRDWDRFMRFMERYSQANGLQFLKK